MQQRLFTRQNPTAMDAIFHAAVFAFVICVITNYVVFAISSDEVSSVPLSMALEKFRTTHPELVSDICQLQF